VPAIAGVSLLVLAGKPIEAEDAGSSATASIAARQPAPTSSELLEPRKRLERHQGLQPATHDDSNEASAIELSGSNIEPVGAGGETSSAGASPGDIVTADLYELNARYPVWKDTSLAVSLGHASLEDDVDRFDRSLSWFGVEPRWDITDKVFVTARVSEIGTYGSDEGYSFDGEILAGGNEAFGFDPKRFQRISAGLGWKPDPHTILKLEAGRDRFWVIDSSSFDPRGDQRLYFGLELVVSF
jgi:hypothetical protein